jgi:hypothetical protein
MNQKTVALLVALSMLAVACSDGGETISSPKSFVGGTDALTFDFVEGAPPEEVFDQGNFPFEVTLNIENEGEYDVPKENLNVTLQGFFPADFGSPVNSRNTEDDLEKTFIDSDGNQVPGGITFLTFEGFNFGAALPANNEFTIRAELCYKYGFTAQTDICVISDVTETDDEEKVCEVDENKRVESSASPLQIENFVENIGGTDRINFNFDVVHRGTGSVSKLGTSCDEADIQSNEDKVFLNISSGLAGLKCSGITDGPADTEADGYQAGFTTLFGGKRFIRCSQDVSDAVANNIDFEKKVTIKGEFEYKEHKSQRILVKHTTP